jgi:hypothetical protein
MADIKPNLELRKRQIQVRILELQLNLQRMDVRKMELDDEKSKIDTNIEATKIALKDLEKELG